VRTTSIRLLTVGAVLATGAVLSSCMPPPPQGGPPAGVEPVERTIDGTVPAGQGRYPSVSCSDVGYVQRGANQTVPRVKMLLEAPLWAFTIARDTVPNEFLSLNVTSMTFALGAAEFSGPDREYHITYWCTSDKDQAWTVFG